MGHYRSRLHFQQSGCTAADGFQAVFALPELDTASADRGVLLADARDGQALSDNEGPLRIAAPAEKYPPRGGGYRSHTGVVEFRFFGLPQCGCVLYEMLTGRATFAGDTPTDTLAAIVVHAKIKFLVNALL